MKVSVIALTYNSETTIRRALDSVLGQQCDFDFEVVIGDDASTDGTVAILDDYASRFSCIRLLKAGTNRGVQANYYDCFEACRGDYIADCAGDDYWNETTRLQQMADVLDRNPDAGMVYTDWLKMDVSSGLSERKRTTLTRDCAKGELAPIMLSSNGDPAINLSAALYRKDVVMVTYNKYRDCLYRNRDYGCEDLQLLTVLAMEAPAKYLPIVSLCYTVGGSQAITSTTNLSKTARFALSTLALKLELMRMFGINNRAIARSNAKLYAFALSMAANSGDKELRKRAIAFASDLEYVSPRTRLKLLLLKLLV